MEEKHTFIIEEFDQIKKENVKISKRLYESN